MNSGLIDSRAFQKAQLRSERIRVIAILTALAALAVFDLIRILWLREKMTYEDWLVPAVLFSAALGYEGIMLRRLGRAMRLGRDLETRARVLNVFVETLFPTIALVVSIVLGYMGPYLTLVSPTVLVYFIFIVLSTLSLQPLLSLLTGISSASGYLAVAVYVLLQNPKPESAPSSLPIEYYLTYTFLICTAGLTAALVSGQIRRHVGAAIREAHHLERLKSDLEIARTIQQGLLPAEPPQIGNFKIAGWNMPADQTGGDYYSWHQLADNRYAITLADVTGHGIGAALIAAACHAYSKASIEEEKDLGTAISRINRLLSQDLPSGKLVTFVAGLLTPRDGRIELLSAGHGPLFLYSASVDRIQSLPAHDIPFGVLPSMNYGPAQELFLNSGDILVLLTDGFFEWRNAEDEEFGLDRLEKAIRASKDLYPGEIINRLYDAVKEFTRGTAQQDDLTALVVKNCLV